MSSVIECHNCKALYVTRQAGECPYCVVQRSNTEIDRLKRELETTQLHLMEEETTRKIWEQDCKKAEAQLNMTLASAREKLKKKDEAISTLFESFTWLEKDERYYREKSLELATELARSKAGVEVEGIVLSTAAQASNIVVDNRQQCEKLDLLHGQRVKVLVTVID